MVVISEDSKFNFVLGIVILIIIIDKDLDIILANDELVDLCWDIVEHINEYAAFSSIMSLDIEDQKLILYPLISDFIRRRAA